MTRPELPIRAASGPEEAEQCASIMLASEPWITLGRTRASVIAALTDPTRELYVAADADKVAGFVLLTMTGALVGYIQTIAVAEEARGQGLGSRLIDFAEDRILRETPNVFMFVSSFNTRAQALYARLGYDRVGELPDYVVRGHSEILLRKSLGPLRN